MSEFEPYKDRRIDFMGVQSISGWNIKIYTITLNASFQSSKTLNHVIGNLPDFIELTNKTQLQTHKHAFIVIHEAREGVWILFSWWTGGEMLETTIRFSSYEDPLSINPSPYSGSLVCTWELEVYIHERQAWIKHVLKKSISPDFISYQNDGLNVKN